jgi:endonuclease/exonuclease/phosphatase family metal-dependent hydrolase
MTLLFWNINKQLLTGLLLELVATHAPDIILLAECPVAAGDLTALIAGLNAGRTDIYRPYVNASRRLVVLSHLPSANVEVLLGKEESKEISHKAAVYRIHPLVGKDFLLVGVHLPSKLHMNDQTQADLATRLRPLIERKERDVNHQRTIVLGDFNMDPFERGVVSSEAFHALMDVQTITQLKGRRTVQGGSRRFFYNPMWSRLGDGRSLPPGKAPAKLPHDFAAPPRGAERVPPGTYYYASSETSAYFWHAYDQVLLRPDFLPTFHQEDVQVLTSTGVTPLLTTKGLPDIANASDHLPLLVKI